MIKSLRSADDAFARGFRDGLRGLLAIGRYDAAPSTLRRQFGSPGADRLARYRDMEAFKADVERGRLRVLCE